MYFNLLHKRRLVNNLTLHRLFFSRNFVTKRECYYTVLGLTPRATVGEIKSAYFNLSMIYHPDKNDGSEEAAQMFRTITEAYEVLSNLNRKKLYDKGLIRQETIWKTKETVTKKSRVPQYGRTPFYDFDSWTKAHYGRTFRRSQAAKSHFDDLESSRRKATDRFRVEVGFLGFFFFIFLVALTLESVINSPLDKPARQSKDRKSV